MKMGESDTPKPEIESDSYRVVSRCTEHGVTIYDYPSRNDALEGLTSIVLADIYLRDGILRWYRVEKIVKEEENGDS